MRTIKNTESVKVTITDTDVIDGRWLPVTTLSNKLKAMEESQKLFYKRYRGKMYNSINSGKYNIVERAGIKFIDTIEPMKTTQASLIVEFTRG